MSIVRISRGGNKSLVVNVLIYFNVIDL